jgi:hypothetical protein
MRPPQSRALLGVGQEKVEQVEQVEPVEPVEQERLR